jgi:hypothetical protein
MKSTIQGKQKLGELSLGRQIKDQVQLSFLDLLLYKTKKFQASLWSYYAIGR